MLTTAHKGLTPMTNRRYSRLIPGALAILSTGLVACQQMVADEAGVEQPSPLTQITATTVTASSVNGTTNTAAKAGDGSTTTRWESTQGVDPQWITVDLG